MKLLLSSMLFCCLLLVLPGFSGNSFAQSHDAITESNVMAVINSIDKAARKGNVAGLVGPLANDVKIKLIASTAKSDKEQVVYLTKEQYTVLTRRALRRRLAYTLERKNTRVKIYDDKKTAMVTSEIYETLTISQGTIRTVQSEVAILTLRNGKLVVTSIDGRVRFY